MLHGQRALISGSSKGIGRGIAIELARQGAEVVVNFRSSPDEAAEVVIRCVEAGGKAHAIGADISKLSEAKRLVDESVEAMGGLDIVVSNAAYSDRHLMLEQDLDEFHRTIEVSMMGAYYLTRFGAERLVAGGGGNIVVISSPHAKTGYPGAMAYNMAKAANDQMGRTAATELAPQNVRVNIIHPGWIDTPGERKFFTEETLQAEGAKIPMGRLGQPEDIGRGVVFLCDPANNYITGSTLTIDGGIQLPWQDMFRIEEAKRAAGK